MWRLSNNKVEWLSAAVLLIRSSVGLVNDQIRRRKLCKFVQPMGRKSLQL
jgi:hypothetical protein